MKKGISTVVATSLIVLITVAAVAIVWTAIIPMIRENAPTNDPCLGVTGNIDFVSPKVDGAGTVTFKLKQFETDAIITKVKVYVYNETQLMGSKQSDAISIEKNGELDVSVTDATFIGGKEIAITPFIGDNECSITTKKTFIL